MILRRVFFPYNYRKGADFRNTLAARWSPVCVRYGEEPRVLVSGMDSEASTMVDWASLGTVQLPCQIVMKTKV